MSSNVRRTWIPARSWFLFNTWFSLLVISVSAAATLGVPMGRAAWPIFWFCSGVVIFLAIRSRCTVRSAAFRWPPMVASALILGAVSVVLWGSLVKGEFVSVYPDAWAYTAFATYVRNPMPAVGAGLQPVVSFGRSLMGARYGTAGLLSLFAEISGTDACRVAGVYACLVLAQTGLGFTLLGRSFGGGRILSICAGVFGVSIGWAPEILKVGNWDQVLFLSFIPFALLRIRLSTFRTSRNQGILGLGACLGAATVAYPEGAALAGVIYLPMLVWGLVRGAGTLGKVKRLVVAVGVALVLTSVYWPTLVSFLYLQVLAGNTLAPGRGSFSGLLSARWLSAVFGLGVQPPTSLKATEMIVPLFFIGLSFVALLDWWRRKDRILLSVPIFLLLSLYQALWLKYDYGFYKVLTMYWPVMVSAIFAGMSQLLAWSPPGLVRFVIVAGYCGLGTKAISDQAEYFRDSPWHKNRRIDPFLELESLKKVSGEAPICIVTQSWFNQEWAVFFLQGHKLVVPNRLKNLASHAIRDVTTQPENESFLLSDEKRPGAIWHNEIFSLQNHLDPVELLGIDAPNSVETVQGDSFVWLDNQFASLTIHSDENRQAFLNIRECWPGPSRPGDKYRTLIVEVNGARAEFPALSDMKVPLKLNQGGNLVRLSCKEMPTATLRSEDTRTLLLGIRGFSLANRVEPVVVTAIDAPNGVETIQGDPFIWLDNQFTDFTIDSDADRSCYLKVRECWPGPSRPGETKRTLIVEANGTKVEVPASSSLKVPLNLNHGSNLVRLTCKEAPTVEKPLSGDTRKLLLGIKGFSLVTHDEPLDLLGIDAPNRVETVQGDSFIWLNNQYTDLTIRSDADRQAFLTIHECWPGPSRPGDTNRTLVVELNGKKVEVPASSNLTVPLQLNKGNNLVRLSCKETPTIDRLSSGDVRILLLGIKAFSVTAAN